MKFPDDVVNLLYFPTPLSDSLVMLHLEDIRH